MSAQSELRSIRSDRLRHALRIYLQRSSVKLGIDVLVLADASGEPVAWSRDVAFLRSTIQRAAALCRDGQPLLTSAERPHQAWPVDLGEGRGFLVAWGGPTVTEDDVRPTCDGIARILTGTD